ncbi:hypothetical protein PENTCL1PPCAC_30635, partial [Pristionchus entomophagus]
GQLKLPSEASPVHYDEDWSHYDKCHFFDQRNRFWDYHHCEYVDCSYYNGSCADSVYGKWPIMVTRYSDGCMFVHDKATVSPDLPSPSGKMMTMCCTFEEDPTRIVHVLPFHMRNN